MTTLDEATIPEAEKQNHELNAFDRCDACGAQAYIRVQLDAGELFFCAHHGRKYEEKLSAIATEWHDESDRLLAKR